MSKRTLIIAGLMMGAVCAAVYFLAADSPQGVGSLSSIAATSSQMPSHTVVTTQPVTLAAAARTNRLAQEPSNGDFNTDFLSKRLRRDLLENSRFDLSWLDAHGFTAGSVSLERLHALLDGQSFSVGAGAQQMAFAPQGAESHLQPGEIPILSTHERYVDTSLSSAALPGDAVILRWRNASDDSVIELSAQATSGSAGGSVPLWKYSPEDWPPGRYRVEVLSADASLALLAAGEFDIAPSNAAVTPFMYSARRPISP